MRHSPAPGGARSLRLRAVLAPVIALGLLGAGCSEVVHREAPPTDRLIYPTGIAAVPLQSGGSGLLVLSSNFDLLYDARTGGTAMSVALSTPRTTGLDVPLGPPEVVGDVLRVPSMGGPVTLALDPGLDPPGTARPGGCPGVGSDLALFTSRYTDELMVPTIEADGRLTCGSNCAVALPLQHSDPLGVAVKCAGGMARAYVGHMRASTDGEITEVVLASANDPELSPGEKARPVPWVRRSFRAGLGVYALAYQPERDRLWVTPDGTYANAPIGVVKLGVHCDPTDLDVYGLPCPRVDIAGDVFTWLRGAELRGLAFANPDANGNRNRLFVAVQLFDPDLALRVGGRPSFDVGAALVVLDVSETIAGNPVVSLARIVPLGMGAAQLRVLPPRAGKGDLVAVVSLTDGDLTLYDDDTGAVAKVFALSQGASDPSGFLPGLPQMGKQPYDLAVEQRDDAGTVYDWIYVTSFLSNTVQVVRLLPDAPSDAEIRYTIGRIP
ncbi:MAG TPA: hypothetical protein VLU43_16465 [Anaeromyxobacteraceae bacterium]|nr:hypothetical protein [Anaeromyxobacteraceae bacterium]